MNSMPRQTTLKDIAEHCGVSVSTVSRVINHPEKINKATVQNVLRAMQELNYYPNEMARNIVSNTHSKLIGFLLPNVMNPFYARFLDTIEGILSNKGYVVTICLIGNTPDKIPGFLNMLISSRASGLLVSSIHHDECREDFERAKRFMKVVSIQGDVDGVDRIDSMDEEATYQMISYLIEKGHRDIAFVGYEYHVSILQKRLNGYLRALRDHDIPVNEDYIPRYGEHAYASGYQMTMDLLALAHRPTAIHCFNEFMAYAAYDAIREAGLSVPEDISLTGYDDSFVSPIMTPKLTTVDTQCEMMARLSTDLLLSRIEGTLNEAPQHIYVNSRFVEGGSVRSI